MLYPPVFQAAQQGIMEGPPPQSTENISPSSHPGSCSSESASRYLSTNKEQLQKNSPVISTPPRANCCVRFRNSDLSSIRIAFAEIQEPSRSWLNILVHHRLPEQVVLLDNAFGFSSLLVSGTSRTSRKCLQCFVSPLVSISASISRIFFTYHHLDHLRILCAILSGVSRQPSKITQHDRQITHRQIRDHRSHPRSRLRLLHGCTHHLKRL